MRSLKPLSLVGRHVQLHPLQLEHAAPLLAAANEARATFALTSVPGDLSSMEEYVRLALREQEAGRMLPFVVFDAEGRVSGSTRYCDIEWWTWPSEPPLPVPSGPDVLEIGWTWYAERVQRTALNTEAKLLLCAHAFEDLGVRRILWKTDARNERSRNAILRIGAKFDGVLRAHRPAADGGVRDSAYYSMLRSEWPEAKRGLEVKLRPRG